MQGTAKMTATAMGDRNAWRWGFTPQAELWNSRFAMLGFVVALFIELSSEQGFLHFWGIL